MTMMTMKIKRVYDWILNTNANSNNETNYFTKVIDDYMACCIHFTSSSVPDN